MNCPGPLPTPPKVSSANALQVMPGRTHDKAQSKAVATPTSRTMPATLASRGRSRQGTTADVSYPRAGEQAPDMRASPPVTPVLKAPALGPQHNLPQVPPLNNHRLSRPSLL